MTTRVRITTREAVEARLLELAAGVLHAPVEMLAADPLGALERLDSVHGLELVAAIEDEFTIELPDTTLIDHPGLEQLSAFVEARIAGLAGDAMLPGSDDARLRRMLVDAELPADIRPVKRTAGTSNGRILLTGATGFVGAYLLRELVRTTGSGIVCLARRNGGGHTPFDRIQRNLAQYGIWTNEIATRLECIDGDLEQPLLGLSASAFERLAQRVDSVYHCAASVDWVRPYDGLRTANVIGTRELLRLACAGPAIPFHFLSSMAVCLSTKGRRDIDEDNDPLADVAGLYLGYAESKCVAEALVRAASHRGLPVTIARPALIAGDSTSGASNPDDLISLLIRGCVHMRAAPDLDWMLDAVPVDHAARVIVGMAPAVTEPTLVHLTNPAARHWRECVLWMRLRGYPMELLPYREWAELARQSATGPAHPLFALRPFFTRTVADAGGRFLPELYEEPRKRTISSDRSHAAVARLGAVCPPLGPALLERYFQSYTARGVLPFPDDGSGPSRAGRRLAGEVESFARRIAARLEEPLRARAFDPGLRVVDVTLSPMGGDSSIVAELTSWRRDSMAGLGRARVTTQLSNGRTQTTDLVVKSKPEDVDVIDVGEHVARLCGDRLGDAYHAWRDHVGFTRGHLRELAIARLDEPAIRAHSPDIVACWDSDGEWVLVTEYVGDAAVANADDRPWSDAEIETALRGLAHIHGAWLGKRAADHAADWLPPLRTASSMASMRELWSAASHNAEPFFAHCGGAGLVRAQRALLNDIAGWWNALERQPRTLIHNDFNPRNVMLRGFGDSLRLCAYDWELATIGAPQRDLAELLCFVLTPESAGRAQGWVGRYRELLQAATSSPLDPRGWDDGFRAALCDVGLDRLPLYAMVHRFRHQRFLPRVAATWFALHTSFHCAP